jgi:flagellar L-ring protein precursor FlgH
VRSIAALFLVSLGLVGCAGTPNIAPPTLSAVGTGLTTERTPIPVTVKTAEVKAPSSLWIQGEQGLFRDLRAYKVGDVVTVAIDIDDKAQFDNASARSRTASAKGGFSLGLGFSGLAGTTGAASADGSLDANASANGRGEGSIDRSEKLHLSVAAIVSEVLPGGNLLISGSQEVRVNNEVRVLNIAGIVRPLDISSANAIAYDKIAEARVSYGGRGKLTAVQ